MYYSICFLRITRNRCVTCAHPSHLQLSLNFSAAVAPPRRLCNTHSDRAIAPSSRLLPAAASPRTSPLYILALCCHPRASEPSKSHTEPTFHRLAAKDSPSYMLGRCRSCAAPEASMYYLPAPFRRHRGDKLDPSYITALCRCPAPKESPSYIPALCCRPSAMSLVHTVGHSVPTPPPRNRVHIVWRCVTALPPRSLGHTVGSFATAAPPRILPYTGYEISSFVSH